MASVHRAGGTWRLLYHGERRAAGFPGMRMLRRGPLCLILPWCFPCLSRDLSIHGFAGSTPCKCCFCFFLSGFNSPHPPLCGCVLLRFDGSSLSGEKESWLRINNTPFNPPKKEMATPARGHSPWLTATTSRFPPLAAHHIPRAGKWKWEIFVGRDSMRPRAANLSFSAGISVLLLAGELLGSACPTDAGDSLWGCRPLVQLFPFARFLVWVMLCGGRKLDRSLGRG